MISKKFKSLLLIGVMGLLANGLFAQGIFFKFNAGYGFGTSSLIGYNSTRNFLGNTTNIETVEKVKLSFGKGVNIGGTFGVMFNDNFGFDLSLSYLMGGTTEMKDIEHNLANNQTYSNTRILSANMLRVMPSLIVSAGFDKINPYAKLGLVIGAGSIKAEENTTYYSGNVDIEKWKYNGGLALGLNAALGVEINMNDNFAIFGELNTVNMSYAPTKGKCTENTKNGADQLAQMETIEKEVEFVDEYTIDNTNDPSPALPAKRIKVKYPFSSVGVNFGVKISL
jgi:opacity protein-like surface antigen